MPILPATRSRMNKVNESGNILGTWYIRLVPSAFWYNRRPGYHFMPGFQVAYALLALGHEMFN